MPVQQDGTQLSSYYRDGSSLALDPLGLGDSTPPTVLVADDEAIVRAVLTSMLRRLGCNVLLAGNAREAVSIYESNYSAIDLVLFDLYLPDMTGEVLYAQLRLINPRARAVLITGNCESELLPDVVAEGVSGVLPKPFDVHELQAELVRVLAA